MYQYILDFGIPVERILEGDIEFRRDAAITNKKIEEHDKE